MNWIRSLLRKIFVRKPYDPNFDPVHTRQRDLGNKPKMKVIWMARSPRGVQYLNAMASTLFNPQLQKPKDQLEDHHVS